jgi:L-amino acid N-acyltransferase YncA
MTIAIRPFSKNDWSRVSEIYHQGLLTRNATFETEVPEYEGWIKKFNSNLLWVAVINDHVIGWAGLQPVSTRKVYEGVMEITIYIDSAHGGKGIGTTLMNHLISESEKSGIWTLYASIFIENIASIRLHETAGFKQIGMRDRIAKLEGKWRTTVLYDRRSEVVGI